MLTPREYQQELIHLVANTNAIITLPTGTFLVKPLTLITMSLHACHVIMSIRHCCGPQSPAGSVAQCAVHPCSIMTAGQHQLQHTSSPAHTKPSSI